MSRARSSDLDAAIRKDLAAKLPSKHELRGMLAGTLQAPMRNLAGTLSRAAGTSRNALEQRQAQLEAQERTVNLALNQPKTPIPALRRLNLTGVGRKGRAHGDS